MLPFEYNVFYMQFVVAKTNPSLTVKIIGYQSGIYLFKVNNRDTKTICKICSKLWIKTRELCQGVVMVSLLVTLNIYCPVVSIVNVEQENAG